MPDLNKQREWWNETNALFLEGELDAAAVRRGEIVVGLLARLRLDHPEILEVGCGNGWLAAKMSAFGHVTGL